MRAARSQGKFNPLMKRLISAHTSLSRVEVKADRTL